MRAVVYRRVSKEDQAISGAGLNAQLDACRAHAARVGCELVGPYTDADVSGAVGLDGRPALLEAVAAIGAGDVLLIAKRDRLGRDRLVVCMIEAAIARQGGRIVSAAGEGTENDDPSSILMQHIIDAFAVYERLIIKARTRAALAAKKRRGERTGGIPFGCDLAEDGTHLTVNDREREVLGIIHRLRAEGFSHRGIARWLDRIEVPTKRGGPTWSHAAVAKLLKSDRHPFPQPHPEPPEDPSCSEPHPAPLPSGIPSVPSSPTSSSPAA